MVLMKQVPGRPFCVQESLRDYHCVSPAQNQADNQAGGALGAVTFLANHLWMLSVVFFFFLLLI